MHGTTNISSDSIVTRHRARWRRIVFRFQAGELFFFFIFQNLEITYGAHTTGDFFLDWCIKITTYLLLLVKHHTTLPPHAFKAYTLALVQILLALSYEIQIFPHIQYNGGGGVGHAVPAQPFTILPYLLNGKGDKSIIFSFGHIITAWSTKENLRCNVGTV